MLFHNNVMALYRRFGNFGHRQPDRQRDGVAFADYDGDGFTDVFVSNDTFRNFCPTTTQRHFQRDGIVGGVA